MQELKAPSLQAGVERLPPSSTARHPCVLSGADGRFPGSRLAESRSATRPAGDAFCAAQRFELATGWGNWRPGPRLIPQEVEPGL